MGCLLLQNKWESKLYTYAACSLAANIQKRIEMLLPNFTVLWCHLPMNQSCRLFNSVLEMAMACWRASVDDLGLDLGDGGPALLDFRFAEDILIFGTSYPVLGTLLGELVENLAAVGFQLNAEKTKILTSQTQPPARLQTPNGLTISIVDQESSHKWLGCMLTTTLEKSTNWDVDHRLQSASRIFNANRWIFCDSRIAISKRLEYFDCVISLVACYAAGHRSQVKSAPTPVGEPNVRAEAEKKNLYMYIPMTVQFAGVFQKTW